MLFLKEHQKKLLIQNSQAGGFYFPGTGFNGKSNGTYPPPVSFLYVENLTKYFQKIFRKYEIFMLFLKEHQKKLLKQNSQAGGFYFQGSGFNGKSNGTYPHLYLSCM